MTDPPSSTMAPPKAAAPPNANITARSHYPLKPSGTACNKKFSYTRVWSYDTRLFPHAYGAY